MSTIAVDSPPFLSRRILRRRIIGALVIVLLATAVNLAISRFGIRTGADSVRYAAAAGHLLRHEPLEEKQPSYIGYDVIYAAATVTGTRGPGLVFFNFLMMALATCAIWSLAGRLYGDAAAFTAALLFAANPEMARWNFYLMTESPYTSAVVLCCWATDRADRRGGLDFLLCAIATLFAATLRPNGWLLPPIVLGYLAWRRVHDMRVRVAAIAAIAAACLFLAVAGPMQRGVQSEGLSHELRIGEVIWNRVGMPLKVSMPPEPSLPETAAGSARYVLRHPAITAKLVALRLYYHLADTRPYYSFAHNTLVAAGLLPVYLLAMIGVIKTWREPPALLLLTVIAAHLGIVAVSFANWDGRFLLYMLPLVFVFSACGVGVLVDTLGSVRQRVAVA